MSFGQKTMAADFEVLTLNVVIQKVGCVGLKGTGQLLTVTKTFLTHDHQHK